MATRVPAKILTPIRRRTCQKKRWISKSKTMVLGRSSGSKRAAEGETVAESIDP